MKNMFLLFLSELLISLIIAATPLFIAHHEYGASGLESTISSLLANGIIINYLFSLFVIALAFSIMHRWAWKGMERSRATWDFFLHIIHEAGICAIGILRSGAGVLVGFPLLWLFKEYDSFSISKVITYPLYALAALLESAFLAWLISNLKSKNHKMDEAAAKIKIRLMRRNSA